MQKKKNTLIFVRGKAGLFSTLVFMSLSLIVSGILLRKGAPFNLYFPLLLSVASISGALGGISATRKERKNGLVNGAMAAVLPIAAYLITVSVMNRGFSLRSLLPCLVLLICSVIAGIAAANRKHKKRIKKRK